MGLEFRPYGRITRRKGINMIRIREISMHPEHNVAQLSFEAAQLLRISASKVRKLKIVRRSVDARKKPDIRIVYTIDVTVDGNEKKILKDARLQPDCFRILFSLPSTATSTA